MEDDKIVVYTDGGCSGNPGPGGWAYIITMDKKTKKCSGGQDLTTNNRMELNAALEALNAIKNMQGHEKKQIQIYSDSKYLQLGITQWLGNWRQRKWKTSEKKPVKNKDMWESIDDLNTELKPQWNWVKGHAGIDLNEECDILCQKEIAKIKKRLSSKENEST